MVFCRLLSLLVLPLLLCGCDDNPGKWPQDKVASSVKEHMISQGIELTEFSISPTGEGTYTGTGLVTGGEKLKIEVTQDPATRKVSWRALGDRGEDSNGSMTK